MIVITNNKRCDCFAEHVANSSMWMASIHIEDKILRLPYFINKNYKLIRYNFCPICGENVRDIEAKRE